MTDFRLFDFIYYQKEHHPQARAFGYKPEEEWVYFSTDDIIDLANRASRGLLKLGIQPGDKIALLAYKNRPEWTIMDIAIQQVGAINVPVYPTISPAEYVYIFNDASVQYAFVGTGDLYDKVKEASQQLDQFKDIYTFDAFKGRPYWRDIFSDEGQEEVDARKAAVKTTDLATLIYTSGTTGQPKGVMLSHRNIATNAAEVTSLLPITAGDTVLSFLPLCHIFERTASYAYTYIGVSVVFTGTDNLGGETGDLQAIKPHFFTTVPRLLEKVYEKIYNKGLALTGLKKTLFFWALGMTEQYTYDKEYNGLDGIKYAIADKLIFSKWREALGGNMKGIITGAAPCPVSMARVFSAAGIPIREGYGLTETSPGLCISRFTKGGAMLGTVGPALNGVTIRIDTSDGDYRPGEGEILAQGPNIMQGYYNKPEATAAVMKELDGETWFCTGDIGTLIDGPNGQKFLKITDRKKELLKTSGGKYVAPAPIENKLKEDFLVEQVMVVGDKKKFVSAVILPAPDALKDWYEEQGHTWPGLEKAIEQDFVRKKYRDIIDQYNPNFSHIEQIKKFALLCDPWEPTKTDGSDAELTPTLKLKRRVILEKCKAEIDKMYNA